MSAPVKTRFAPSPTGRLHLGNVRTALFSWLLAHRLGGGFLLRFEDTDLERSAQAFEAGMEEDLHWLGLDWDEGPGAGGDAGPYRQSERGDIYDTYFQRLEHAGQAYPCFCSQQQLALSRKAQLAAGRPPRYAGTCAHLTPEQVQERLDQGDQPTLRFRVPDDRCVEFEDLVRERQRFECADIGDFVIRRSDGTPAFFFSNAVDDALMGVTHVLRGEDHLANTPRQMLILEALGLRVPRYGHTAMLVGADGAPLSKRSGSRSLEELRQAGYLPGALLNYLARLGHHYEHDAWLEHDALAAAFELNRVGRSPAHYDAQQLLHWQKEAVARATNEQLWNWMSGRSYAEGGRMADFVHSGHELEFVQAIRDNVVMPGDGFVWAGQLFSDGDIWTDEAREAIRGAGRDFFETALQTLADAGADFKGYSQAVAAAAGVKGKALFMPLRAALTGETHGPEMARVWPLMGQARAGRRLQAVIETFSS